MYGGHDSSFVANAHSLSVTRKPTQSLPAMSATSIPQNPHFHTQIVGILHNDKHIILVAPSFTSGSAYLFQSLKMKNSLHLSMKNLVSFLPWGGPSSLKLYILEELSLRGIRTENPCNNEVIRLLQMENRLVLLHRMVFQGKPIYLVLQFLGDWIPQQVLHFDLGREML